MQLQLRVQLLVELYLITIDQCLLMSASDNFISRRKSQVFMHTAGGCFIFILAKKS